MSQEGHGWEVVSRVMTVWGGAGAWRRNRSQQAGAAEDQDQSRSPGMRVQCARNQARVRERPSERGWTVEAERAHAGDVEELFHLTVGFGGVPDDVTGEAGVQGDVSGELTDGSGTAGGKVDRFTRIVVLDEPGEQAGDVAGIDEIADRFAGPPTDDLAGAVAPGLPEPADESGDDMGLAEAEVIELSVEIAGNEDDGIEAVLTAIGVAGNESELFGRGVGGAFGLGEAVPHLILANGGAGGGGITAAPHCVDEFGDPGFGRFLKHQGSEKSIPKVKIGWKIAISANSTNISG